MQSLLTRFFILRPNRIVYTHASYWLAIIVNLPYLNKDVAHMLVLAVLFFLFYGAVYIMNDLFDYPEDSKDPVLSKRLIASGRVTYQSAAIQMMVIFVLTLTITFFVDRVFFSGLIILLLLNIIYSWRLKKIAYLDLLFMSFSHPMKYTLALVSIGLLAVPYLNASLLIYIYFCALHTHTYKQLARVLSNRPRKMMVGEFRKEVLMRLLVFATLAQLFVLVSIPISLLWIAIVLTLSNVLITILLLFSKRGRVFLQHKEEVTSVVW